MQEPGPSSPHHEPMGNKHATWKCGLSACARVPLCLCVSDSCVPCVPVCLGKVWPAHYKHCDRDIYAHTGVPGIHLHSIYKKTILSASSIFNLEGPIRWRMGWPRVAGRGGPRHTRAHLCLMMFIFNAFNIMFYDDRLRKLVCALALLF